jgi:ABC-type Na+ efflux pump permease subunit
MVMYFLVLFYGQGVANSVVLEKTSKLMDFFLVTVEPTAMVLGKVLAMATAALLQLGAWLVSLTAGFAVGAMLCRSLAPDAQFGILTFFDSLTWLEGMFSLSAVLLSVGIMVGGFLLYCALAGVGGAMAGKAEDLSNTNVLFSLTLVASFLICLLSGGGDGIISEAAWLGFVPFTAILVAPARLLLGQMSPWWISPS